MNTITAEEFQAACMTVLEQVRATGQPVRITQHGEPIATVVPEAAKELPRKKTPKRLGTAVKGGKILGDIMVPTSELVRWEALNE